MRVLVTGAAGYIGSVATDLLLDNGFDVVAVDDLSNGHRGAVNERAVFVQLDMLDTAALTQVLRRHRCDAAFHFAAEALIPVAVRDPGRAWRLNLSGTLSLCSAMVAADVRKLVFSSTAAVYGTPAEMPITEAAPTAPINAYGDSKLAGERMLANFALAHGIEYVALRYFNVCGATPLRGEDRPIETHIIPIALDVALGRVPRLTIFGTDYPTPDGTCVRDYVHVADIAGAHLSALAKLGTLPQRAYNVGIGKGFSVLEVVRAAEQACGTTIRSELGPRRDGDPPTLLADPAAFTRDTGFRPAVTSLDRMVGDALAWRRAHPHGYGGS
jgi:UDP-glucose 4-epimerase